MSDVDPATLWQRWYDRVWSNGKSDAITAMLAPNARLHYGPGDAVQTVADFQAFHARVLSTWPRVEGRVHDPIVSGEWVSVRTELLLGGHAEHRDVQVFGLQRARVRDGQFVEVWDSWDWTTALAGAGQLPADAVGAFLTS